MSAPESQEDRVSLQRQLRSAQESLRLIRDREAEYVLSTDVPLQLIKEERQLQERIAKLESDLAPALQPSGAAGVGVIAPTNAIADQPSSSSAAESKANASPLEQAPDTKTAVSPASSLVKDAEPSSTLPAPEKQYVELPASSEPSTDVEPPASMVIPQSTPPSIPRTPRRAWWAVAALLLVADIVLVAVAGWRLLRGQPDLVAYIQTFVTVLSLLFAIAAIVATVFAIVVVPRRKLVLEDVWRHLVSRFLWRTVASEAVIGVFLLVLLIWPTSVTRKSGDTQVRETDGMTQVYVPGGTFQMGSTTGDADEEPVHAVTLDASWLDRTEVTNAQYARCVAAGRCAAPSQSRSATREAYYDQPEFATYPVLYVNRDDAQTYCQWVGAQLPTEAQWEFAARGPQNFAFPWGNAAPNTDRLNYDQNVGDTMPVEAYAPGVSWVGALNLSGNVYEWVSDWYAASYPAEAQRNPVGPALGDKRIIRGGGWHSPVDRSRATYRNVVSADYRDNNLGFRCVSNAIIEAP